MWRASELQVQRIQGLSPAPDTHPMDGLACLVIMKDVAALYLPTAARILRLGVEANCRVDLASTALLLPFSPSQDLEHLVGSAFPSSSPTFLSISSCATLPGDHPLLEPHKAPRALSAPCQGPLYCSEGLASSKQGKSLQVLTVPQLALHPGGPRARDGLEQAQ